jgi:hypothetical protein
MTAIRRPGTASVVVLLGLGGSLVAAHALAPEWSRRTGLDVWNLSADEARLRAAIEDRAEVEAFAERAARRREAANQVATKLIVGATTLPAAADEIAEIFYGDSTVALVFANAYPDAPTERHRVARHTIDRVKHLLEEDPVRCAVVVGRLEAEYRALLNSPESPHAP